MEEKGKEDMLDRLTEIMDNLDNDNEWSCRITNADNGFILEQFGCEPGTKVIEEKHEDSDKDELLAMEELLWIIKEFFGCHYSKHNKYNLEIGIKEREHD